MGQIILEFDNRLKQSEIVVPLVSSSLNEAGDNYTYNREGIQQTSIFGILTPLIQINNIVVDFKDIENFSLRSIGTLPQVSLSVRDRYGLIKTLDTPTNDNELRIQILPQFDNAYKKINLTFYISNINIYDDIIDITGAYKVPKLTSSQFECMGELDTYNVFKQVAQKTLLGFATNCEEMSDKRYMYCNHISYHDLLNDEIIKSQSDETHIYDWWIDLWNNVNLVNIYERYNTIDPEEEMMIWVSGQQNTMIEGVNVQPHKLPAILNNHPAAGQTELKVIEYEIVNKSGSQMTQGTDKVYSYYQMDINEYKDVLIQDGDQKEDIFEHYEYLGEVYGEYNYLLAESCRDAFLQKMGTESIKVTLKTPLLALMRGHKVNFLWYNIDDRLNNSVDNFKSYGIINDNVGSIPNLDNKMDDIKDIRLDDSISGQYMVTGQDISYFAGEWEYILILNRPLSHKPKMLIDLKNENNK